MANMGRAAHPRRASRGLLALLFLLLAAGATLAFPWALRQLIDQGLTGPGSAERLAGQFMQLFGVAAALAMFSAARF